MTIYRRSINVIIDWVRLIILMSAFDIYKYKVIILYFLTIFVISHEDKFCAFFYNIKFNAGYFYVNHYHVNNVILYKNCKKIRMRNISSSTVTYIFNIIFFVILLINTF